MKLFKISALLFAVLFSVPLLAQNKIYFCEDVSETGEPVGHAAEWAIPQGEAGIIYTLYTNNKKPIKDATLTIKRQKKNESGTYDSYDELTVEAEAGKTWVFFEMEYADAGEYTIIIADAAGKNLASEKLTIVVAETEEPAIEDISAEHAKGYILRFSTEVDEENSPINPTKEFKLAGGKAIVKFNFAHMDDLKANRFVIEIAKTNDKKNAPESFEVEVEPEWVSFVYENTFTVAGKYTITIKSPSGKVLSSETITVK